MLSGTACCLCVTLSSRFAPSLYGWFMNDLHDLDFEKDLLEGDLSLTRGEGRGGVDGNGPPYMCRDRREGRGGVDGNGPPYMYRDMGKKKGNTCLDCERKK